jgi:hypothetical protein
MNVPGLLLREGVKLHKDGHHVTTGHVFHDQVQVIHVLAREEEAGVNASKG